MAYASLRLMVLTWSDGGWPESVEAVPPHTELGLTARVVLEISKLLVKEFHLINDNLTWEDKHPPRDLRLVYLLNLTGQFHGLIV